MAEPLRVESVTHRALAALGRIRRAVPRPLTSFRYPFSTIYSMAATSAEEHLR